MKTEEPEYASPVIHRFREQNFERHQTNARARMKNDLELAKADGFDSLTDFRKWFIGLYEPTDETKFMIVKW